jgi:hypothetical protein
MGFSLLDAWIYGPFSKASPFFVEPWVAVSDAGNAASGTFFGVGFVDFIHTRFVSAPGHFHHFSFNFLTFRFPRR